MKSKIKYTVDRTGLYIMVFMILFSCFYSMRTHHREIIYKLDRIELLINTEIVEVENSIITNLKSDRLK